MASKDKFEDLDLSQDEIKRLGEALKDEKFRKLFVEYAQEISDPENKKRYEEEIAQLENERGMDVSFIHPEPGYVIKTSVNGDTKMFINICKNSKIGKPTATRKEGPDGRSGVQWSIPHSFAPARDDVDKTGNKCRVVDVVFHPDTYRMAETNDRFRKLVDDTALDGIESQYGLKLDRKNIKTPKMTYKGMPTATVIRSKIPDKEGKSKKSGSSVMDNFPYPYGSKTSEELAKEKAQEVKKKAEMKKKEEKSQMKRTVEANSPTEPKYSITHRSEMDMQEYRNAPDSRPSTRPKELVVAIDLPLLSSAASVGLDIFEKKLVLESVKPAAYKLDLNLPFPVDDTRGSAKFDKAKHRLTVTLPVIPAEVPDLPTFINKDEVEVCEPTIQINGHENGDSKPLIEVLSSNTLSTETTPIISKTMPDNSQITPTNTETQNHNDNNQLSLPEDNKNIWAEEMISNANRHIAFRLPVFSHRQDNETVSFVLDVKNVTFDSVTKLFPSPTTFQLRFASVGSGCFPMYYSIYLRFPDDCEVCPDHCSIDVGEKNLVILILKSRNSRGLWQKFWVGEDENHLAEKLFATEDNLELELCQLEREALANEKMVQTQDDNEVPKVKVTEMSEKALKINLSLGKKGKVVVPPEECNEDENQPRPDIEVICERQSRHLHGILKQRSRSHSESSDDVSSASVYSRENSTSSGSHMSESPISESEEADGSLEGRLKKSVSFSDHVDKATFKPGATVSSMTTVLKSKRRRNRKREEKKRRRHNSTGSEYSSSDEHPHHHDCDTGDEPQRKNEDKGKGSSNKAEESTKQKSGAAEKTGKVDDKVASLDEAYRTSEINVEPSAQCDSSVGVEQGVPSESVSTEGCPEGKREGSDAKSLGAPAPASSPTRTKPEAVSKQAQSCDINGRGDTAPDPQPKAGGDSTEVESMLSWKEREGSHSQQHKTQCAFNFSNSVMFDLDVD